jgi:acyl-CoA synthetase (AMP-forming)/AMP-acid ligase II
MHTASTLVVETSPLPATIIERLRADRVTVVAGVPPLWIQLLGVPSFVAEPIPSVRILQNAGGHCPRETVRQLREAQPQASLFLQYGMTETFRSTFLPPDEVDRRPDSMGRALDGVEILVVSEDGAPCAPGEIGELVHRGRTIASGYWNDAEGTARVFRPHPFAPPDAREDERVVFSGDMVRRDADGFLYFVSRRDRLIKSLGFRVGPDEIVDVLFASHQIREAVVTTEPDVQRGARIVAYVVLAPGGSKQVLELFSRTEFPRHMQPARIEIRETLRRLPSGKYDLDAIRGDVR